MKRRKKKPAAKLPATAKANLPAAPITEAQATINMIERVARDKDSDVDKLKELIALKNSEQDRVSRSIAATAMVNCQEEMEPVRRDCVNTHTKSRYASYEALDRALRPIYSKYGFALSFSTVPSGSENMMRFTCKVMHKAGHVEHHQIDVPIVTKGPKGNEVMTPTHATMSAKTIGKRALLDMIFNVATTDIKMDDDGNAAGGLEVCNEDQITQLYNEIEIAKLPMDKFEIAFGKVEQLPAHRFDEALDRIKQFKQRGFQKAE